MYNGIHSANKNDGQMSLSVCIPLRRERRIEEREGAVEERRRGNGRDRGKEEREEERKGGREGDREEGRERRGSEREKERQRGKERKRVRKRENGEGREGK